MQHYLTDPSAPAILLTPTEVRAVVGYAQPARQLQELHRLGFWRARRAPVTGEVILERAHYEAVCQGQDRPGSPSNRRAERAPQVRLA